MSDLRRSLALLSFGAVLVIAGCAGDGKGTTVVPGDGNRVIPSFVLGDAALVETVILSGSDIVSGTNQIAVIENVFYGDEDGNQIPTQQEFQPSPLKVFLDQPVIQNRPFTATLASSQASRVFDLFPFEIKQIQVDTGSGLQPLTPANQIAYSPIEPYDLNLRLFRGRTSAVQLRLSNRTLQFSFDTGVDFNDDQFIADNYNEFTNSIRGFLSDYVAFDLSGVAEADRPLMETGGTADRILFSGDGIMLSRGIGDESVLELLDPEAVTPGVLLPATTIDDRPTAKSYILEDPALINSASMFGTWRHHTEAIIMPTPIAMVAFPSSDDDAVQQVVYFQVSGNQVVQMWQGQIEYGIAGDMTKGTIQLFPIRNVATAGSAGEITGTVSAVTYDANGAARSGDFTLNAAPGTLPLTGAFAVFRR